MFKILGLYDPGVLLCVNEQTLAVIPKPKSAKLKKRSTMSWNPPYSQVLLLSQQLNLNFRQILQFQKS
jgi:hypothetical protein